MGNFWMIGECGNSLKKLKETFFTNTIIITNENIKTTTKDWTFIGIEGEVKAKVGCKWHPIFP